MNFQFHAQFIKSYRKLSPKLQESVNKKLVIFAETPFAAVLNNHSLSGKYINYRSINITGDFRALYKQITAKEIVFVKLGKHSQLYH